MKIRVINKMILVFKPRVRTMHTTNTAMNSNTPQRISAFASEMLKWENPAIDLSQGVNYCGIKSIAIFFKKIGYDSFISFFDSSKSGAHFINSKLEATFSNFNLNPFMEHNIGENSISYTITNFKNVYFSWVPYKPEGFIKETLLFLFQHWHMTSVVVSATAYFIYMHFFNDANGSSSTENNSTTTSSYITEPDVAVVPTATSDAIMGEQSINDNSGSEGNASPEEHIIDAGSVSGESAAAAVVGAPISQGHVIVGGGAVESKEVAVESVTSSTAVTLLSREYKKLLETHLMLKIEKSIIRPIIKWELTCFLNTSDKSEEIMNTLTQNTLDIEKRRLDENFNLIFNGFVKKNCGSFGITSETTAFVNNFLTTVPEKQSFFNRYILIELETIHITSIIKPVIRNFILTGENIDFTRFTESTFRDTFKEIIYFDVCNTLDFYLLNAQVIYLLQLDSQDKIELHNSIRLDLSDIKFNKVFDQFITNNYNKGSAVLTKEEFKSFLYNQRPGDLLEIERIDFLFSFKKETLNYYLKYYINLVFKGLFTFSDIYDGTNFKKVTPPTTVGATGGSGSGGGGAVEAKEPEVLSGGES
jgi:hypothetical protein